jgi:protein-disulfide isomerase
VKKYDGKVRVVYKNFVVHPDKVMDAHLAGCAAQQQGKFKEFKTIFWDKGFRAYAQARDPSKLGKENILKMAAEAGLDTNKLKSDMASERCKGLLASDMKTLQKFGTSGTPSFYINGKFTMFSRPDAFMKMIDEQLAEVEKSGVPADQYYEKVVMGQGLKQFRSKLDADKAGKK